MSIAHNELQNYLRDNIKYVGAAATLKVTDQTVVLTVTGAYTVTLPEVAEARGRMYSFTQSPGVTGTGDITITDAGDDASFTDVIIDAENEKATLYSDGVHWHMLEGATS